MSIMDVNWRGEGTIMMMDLPINYLLKAWAVGQLGDWAHVAAAVIGAAQYYFYGDVIKSGNLVNNSNAWDALSALGTTALGVLIFGEQPTNKQWLGAGFIIAGLALM